jgi:hypothetical protein
MVLINSECITSWNDKSKRIQADQYSESLVQGFLKTKCAPKIHTGNF